MKNLLKIIAVLFLLVQISVSGQKIPDDSLLKKARLEIYDNPDMAISITKNLLKKTTDIKKSITLYMLLSTANIAKRDFDESLKYILKAKELAQKTNDLQTKTSVLVSVAIQYQQMELFSKSLETLDEADIYLSQLPDNSREKFIEKGRGFAIRGMIYKSQSNPEIALEKLLQAIENFKKVDAQKATLANMSIVYYNIGYCYLNLNETDKAQEAFSQAADYARKSEAKSLEAFALKGIAELYKQKRKHQEALDLLTHAENLSKNTGDLILDAGIYKEMADNYLAMGNQNQYQIYNKKYFEMHFRRVQNELTSINQAIDHHNRETSVKSGELRKVHTYSIAAIIGIALLCIAVILSLIFKIRKENKKYQKEIQQLIRS
ncbi:tetratricopeptide repeat protein [Chryseobacterium daeguense]|uniref:tetratricopeptide repeat protein n=1 Tax=Chryseobacterium daeguense TaxID=412438 RepID=UPI0004280B31|nr:tetratricopeptide repeat protein [Chryseobacterium daeguense]